MGHEDWDAVAAAPDALPAGWRRRARREHLDLLNRWVGRPTGRWLKTDLFEERLPERALLPSLPTARWIGMDVSPVVVAGARPAVGGRGVVADARALPFRAGAFDGVLSTSTLDHFDDVADIGRSLVELARVTARGGRLVLTLDNAAHPLIRLRNALPRRAARVTGLVPFAVGATLDEAGGRLALDGAGFDVEATAHLLHAPHVVGTRLARFGWWERLVLPRFAALAGTPLAPRTGHFVAFLARRR
jgi:SAM-dependent methyltransferase